MDSNYFYVHGVSYWPGNERESNLIEHINTIKTLPLSRSQGLRKNLIILIIMMDAINEAPIPTIEHLNKLKNETNDIKILYFFNSGGTVRALSHVHKYLTTNNIETKYVSVWEDDACPHLKYFLDEASLYLSNGYCFVGSLYKPERYCKFIDATGKELAGKKTLDDPHNKRNVPYVPGFKNEEMFWCEDPYITTIEKLNLIKETIGEFTTAPPDEPYHYFNHGINQGEVGFPTRLYNKGLDFYGLPKDELIKLLNTRTVTKLLKNPRP